MPETCRRGRTRSTFCWGLACCTHHIPGGERERTTRAHETSANVRSSRKECARMQPDGEHVLAASASHNHAGARACTAAGTISITHLEDHVVVDSKSFNARLHVLCCHVSCGADLARQLLHRMFVGAVEVFSFGQQVRPVRGVQLVKSGGSVVAPRLGALGLPPPSVGVLPQVDGAADASQGVLDDVHRLHACAQARLPHSDSRGQLWDGSAACGCPRQQDEITQGKRVRTCIRCGCGCGRCAHATVVQQLQCTLAMPQHSRPVNSRARSSVAVGQLVRGGVSKGRTRAVVAVV